MIGFMDSPSDNIVAQRGGDRLDTPLPRTDDRLQVDVQLTTACKGFRRSAKIDLRRSYPASVRNNASVRPSTPAL